MEGNWGFAIIKKGFKNYNRRSAWVKLFFSALSEAAIGYAVLTKMLPSANRKIQQGKTPSSLLVLLISVL
jgi:hypothetical protein